MSVQCFSTPIRRFSFALLSILLGLSPAVLNAVTQPACDDFVPLLPSETWRDPGTPVGAACFAITTDHRGVLLLELTQAVGTPSAYIELQSDGPNAPHILYRTASSLIVALAPGSHPFRVLTADPKLPLLPFRLRSGFTAIATKGENDSEIELEPDPTMIGGDFTKGENDSEIELEPDPSLIEPDASVIGLHALCKSASGYEGQDDHGDSVACATTIDSGRSVVGELVNGWGDDVDVFRFDVHDLATVEIIAHSDSELVVALLDQHGQRLGSPARTENLRWIRTLAPGSYFLRLDRPSGMDRHYSVRLTSSGSR